ncbi:MAG: YceI family protein [Verrucomicrobiota bacterium]
MKSYALSTACLLLAASVAAAADAPVRLDPMPGSKVRIEGTSSIHDWQVEGTLIGGFIEAGAGFPLDPGQAVPAGKVEARAVAFIPIKSLTSVEKDGKPYSTHMDDIMYEKLLQSTTLRITYRLQELVLKESPKDTNAPYVFDSKGSLIVAGVTNTISMPVNITPLGARKVRITGTTTVKMTDFKIQPPAPAIAMGMIKTGDDVKLIFDWMVGQKAAPAAAK